MAYYMEEEHGESIYNLIPPPPPPARKPLKYKSTHDPEQPPSASTFHTKGTTVGAVSNLAGDAPTKPVGDLAQRGFGKPPGASQADPQNRLQMVKGTRVATLSEVKKTNPDALQPSQLKPKMRPDVPKRDEHPVMGLASSKNFVVANAVETILAAPKKVSDGARDYLNKEDFGKTPKYLHKVKQDIDDEKSYIQNLMQQHQEAQQSLVRPLEEGEREQLITGLKAKWEQVNVDYQAMAHLTKLDTVGKVRRKEQMEAKLSQIEKDIERLSKKNILVHSEF